MLGGGIGLCRPNSCRIDQHAADAGGVAEGVKMKTGKGKLGVHGQRARLTLGEAGGQLDPAIAFDRYQKPACKRFAVMARTQGHHAFHDLDELAKDFYDDFWIDWLTRPRDELTELTVAYIATAMMNKLRDLSRRGRSVRVPQLVSDRDEILATVAAEDPEPSEQMASEEQMWLLAEVVDSLPRRARVAFLAVFSRDSKKKGSPLAGYKLAALQLGVSESRAKKLSLSANRLIRAAVGQIESGTWCERWAQSIRLVAAGGEGEAGFRRHVEHCATCRAAVVDLRHQIATGAGGSGVRGGA